MAKSSRGNQYNLHLPADFGPKEFDPSDGTIRKVREVKKIPGEQDTLPNVANQDCHQNEDPNQHKEQEEVHDSAQAGNGQTKNRLPVLEKKQKNFPLPKKEEEKKFKSEHCTLLELENKMKQVNLSGPFRLLANQEEIVTPKKLQEYRKQQIARKAKDHLRNKGGNGLSGRENNAESVEQETNQPGQALPGQEQMQFVTTQTQAKLPNRRHTTKESDCGSLVQPRRQQKVCTYGLETRPDGSNESSKEHAPTPPKKDVKRSSRRPKRNIRQPFRETRAAPACHFPAFGRKVLEDKSVVTPAEHEEIRRKIREAEREEAQLLRDLKAKLKSNGTTSEGEMQLKAKAMSDQEQQPMKKPARFRRLKPLHQTQEQPHQQQNERTTHHPHASQMQQQHQEMQRPSQYAMLVVCAEGKSEDLSHLSSRSKEEATEPGQDTVRRRGQWNRNQPSSQPEGFHFTLATGQSHSSEFTLQVNSSRPVTKIEAHISKHC